MFETALSPKKSFFWTVITALVIASGLFTHRYFTQSYPVVSLSISMDREQALKKAELLSIQHAWLPLNPRRAIEFKHDQLVHYFIELECGGKEAFSQLLHTKEYEPYQWHVRHFQEKTTYENSLFFTPDGTPYGFTVKLPETEILPTLSTHAARELAHTVAVEEWKVCFDSYKEIETSKDLKPCGRLDHSFVYERTDVTLGAEGKYRLKLVVSGNTVTEVSHFVFIPETFKRRFQEMRSSNATVLTCGTLGLQLLYIFAGCLIAGFFFLRKRYLLIMPAFYWAAFFGLLLCASLINDLPHAWIAYDTATSASSFLFSYLVQALAQAVITISFFTTIFSVALTWDRLAFPSRLSFWKLWSPTVGSSYAILGRTLGGYAFFVIFLGIMTATYLLLTKVFHWWCPADTLVDPTILATYLPWLTPFSQALTAGFCEEILFRALPLAACAVIGRYCKREKTGIFLGFILQALIFAACHAAYPQYPGYFRLVELLIPSWIFGALYLYFGLLPGILAHFFFDLFFMSLPIFATSFSQALISKSIIITLFLFPLLIVLYRRLKRGSWYIITEQNYNSALVPIEPVTHTTPPSTHTSSFSEQNNTSTISNAAKRILLTSGTVGLGLWIWCTPFTPVTSPLNIQKSQALAVAEDSFTAQEIPTPPGFNWKPYFFIASIPTDSEFFVWRTEGKENYQRLLGSYLTPPSWVVRYLSFSGTLTDRAFEFVSLVGPDGTVLRSNLVFPESVEGASLQEGEARRIALEALHDQHALDPTDLKEISATPQERPHRKDWTFVFQDKKISFSAEGEARIQVTIVGDKVTNINRFIFVPEAWLRDQNQTNLYLRLLNFFILFIKAFAFFGAFILLQKSLFHSLSVRKIALYASVLIPIILLAKLNELAQLLGTSLISSRPYEAQLFTLIATLVVTPAIVGAILSVLLSSLKNIISTRTPTSIILYAMGAELTLQGIMQAILFVRPRYIPFIPDYVNFNSYSPFFGLASSAFLSLIQNGILELICIAGFTLLIKPVHHIKRYALVFFLISSLSYCYPLVLYPSTALLIALVLGAVFTFIYFSLLRYDQRAVIIMVATRIVLGLLQQGFQHTYPHLLAYSILVSGGIMLISYYWFTALSPVKDYYE
jgi:hypothetical protein